MGDDYYKSLFGEAREKIIKASPMTGQSPQNAMDYCKPVTYNLEIPPGHLGTPNLPNVLMIEYQVFYTDEPESSTAFYTNEDKWLPYKGTEKDAAHRHLLAPDPLTFASDCFEDLRVIVDGTTVIDNFGWNVRSKANHLTRTLCSDTVREQRLGPLPYCKEPKQLDFNFKKESIAAANPAPAADTTEAKYTRDYVTNVKDLSQEQKEVNALLWTESRRSTNKLFGSLCCTPFMGNYYNATMVTLEEANRGRNPNTFVNNFLPEETKLQFEINLASQLNIARRLHKNYISHEEYFTNTAYPLTANSADDKKRTFRVVITNLDILYKVIEVPLDRVAPLRQPGMAFNFLYDIPRLSTYTIESELNMTDASFRIPAYAFCAYIVRNRPHDDT